MARNVRQARAATRRATGGGLLAGTLVIATMAAAQEPVRLPAAGESLASATPGAGATGLRVRTAAEMRRLPALAAQFPSDIAFTGGGDCAHVRRQFRILNPRPMLGEPLLVEIRLEGIKNFDPSSTAEFIGPLQVGRDLRLRVQGPQGIQFEVEPAEIDRRPQMLSYRLGPGEAMTSLIVVASDRNSISGSLFDLPGEYTFELSMRCITKESNPMGAPWVSLGSQAVVAVEPDEAGAMVWNLLDDPGDYSAFDPPLRARTERQRAKLERIARELPASHLRPYALVALGTDHYLGARDAGEFALARPYYEEFLRFHADHPLAGSIAYRLARVYDVAGERELAVRTFEALWTSPAETHRFRDHEEMRQQFLGPVESAATGWNLFEDPRDAAGAMAPEEKRTPSLADLMMNAGAR